MAKKLPKDMSKILGWTRQILHRPHCATLKKREEGEEAQCDCKPIVKRYKPVRQQVGAN